MLKKVILFLTGFLFLTFASFSQSEKTLFGKNGLRISGVWGGPVVGVTEMNENPLVLRGGMLGLEFNKKLLLGWISIKTDNDVYWDALDNDYLQMNYSGLIANYTFNSHQLLHPQLQLITAHGHTLTGSSQRDDILLLQPSLGLEINVFRWFHINLDAGYRMISNASLPDFSNQTLSGVYGGVQMKFGYSW